MIGDPRDKAGYGIAIASLGVALALLVAGVCWIAAQDGDTTTVLHGRECASATPVHCRPEVWSRSVTETTDIPSGLWVALAAMAGVLVGALIPPPPRQLPASLSDTSCPPRWLLPVIVGIAAVVSFIVADDNHEPLPLYAVGSLFAGLFLGLLIPAPGQED